MDCFTAFSMLIAAGLLVAAFLPGRIADRVAYQKALRWLLVGLILYYPVPEIFGIGVYLGFVTRPAGFVVGLLSLRCLCRALGALPGDGK